MNYNRGNFGRDFDSSFTIPRMRGNGGNPDNYLQFSNRSPVLNYDNQFDDCCEDYTKRPRANNDTQQLANVSRPFERTLENEDYRRTSWINNDTPQEPTLNFQKPLKRTWNDPKPPRPAGPSYKATFGDLYDATLPKELLLLFQPLYCKLCTAQLSSNVMAKTHYKSKKHDKKVRTWLTEYSEKSGEPLHKRAALPRPKNEDEYDPKYFHCDVCDLNLTGKIHAESHYMGKHHQRAVLGKKNPAGKGYHSDDGKWIRTVTAKDDPTGRDGFGQDFAVQETIAKSLKTVENAPKITKAAENSLKCDLCEVVVTSLTQLDMHLQGQRHKKKIKHAEDGMLIAAMNGDGSEMGENSSTKSDSDMLSSYRTPSGHFYCKTCNLSMNSEVQFMQHLKSKKHSKKLTGPTTPPPTPTSAVSGDTLVHD